MHGRTNHITTRHLKSQSADWPKALQAELFTETLPKQSRTTHIYRKWCIIISRRVARFLGEGLTTACHRQMIMALVKCGCSDLVKSGYCRPLGVTDDPKGTPNSVKILAASTTGSLAVFIGQPIGLRAQRKLTLYRHVTLCSLVNFSAESWRNYFRPINLVSAHNELTHIKIWAQNIHSTKSY